MQNPFPQLDDKVYCNAFCKFLDSKGVYTAWTNGYYDDQDVQGFLEEFEAIQVRAFVPTITRKFLRALKFRVMDAGDRLGFQGAESPVPMIAEYADKYIVIIDGSYSEIIDAETLEQVDTCEDIRALPVA